MLEITHADSDEQLSSESVPEPQDVWTLSMVRAPADAVDSGIQLVETDQQNPFDSPTQAALQPFQQQAEHVGDNWPTPRTQLSSLQLPHALAPPLYSQPKQEDVAASLADAAQKELEQFMPSWPNRKTQLDGQLLAQSVGQLPEQCGHDVPEAGLAMGMQSESGECRPSWPAPRTRLDGPLPGQRGLEHLAASISADAQNALDEFLPTAPTRRTELGNLWTPDNVKPATHIQQEQKDMATRIAEDAQRELDEFMPF